MIKRRDILLGAALTLLPMLISCANPSYSNIKKGFVATNWKTIAVVPFSGDQRFANSATDTFVIHLMNQDKLTVIEPKTVEFRAKEIFAKINRDSISVFEAQQIGKLLNTDGVIIGSVSSYNNGMTLNGFATVRLIDTRTGEIVAASHKPSGLLFAWSEHQCVMKATERAADDIVLAIEQLKITHIPSVIKNSPSQGERRDSY